MISTCHCPPYDIQAEASLASARRPRRLPHHVKLLVRALASSAVPSVRWPTKPLALTRARNIVQVRVYQLCTLTQALSSNVLIHTRRTPYRCSPSRHNLLLLTFGTALFAEIHHYWTLLFAAQHAAWYANTDHLEHLTISSLAAYPQAIACATNFFFSGLGQRDAKAA